MNVAMKIVVFLDVTPSTTESHLRVLRLVLLHQVAKINTGIQTGVTAAKNSLGSC
jgi:hypothetical protein